MPVAYNEYPEKIIFVIPSDCQNFEKKSLKKSFRKYLLPLLDAAGYDYDILEENTAQAPNSAIRLLPSLRGGHFLPSTDSEIILPVFKNLMGRMDEVIIFS